MTTYIQGLLYILLLTPNQTVITDTNIPYNSNDNDDGTMMKTEFILKPNWEGTFGLVVAGCIHISSSKDKFFFHKKLDICKFIMQVLIHMTIK
jgi:hypothetical protein